MFATMKQWLVNLYLDEEGASGIEYALVAAMVAVIIAGLSNDIQTQVRSTFNRIACALGGGSSCS